jgi:hypothetical protein
MSAGKEIKITWVKRALSMYDQLTIEPESTHEG